MLFNYKKSVWITAIALSAIHSSAQFTNVAGSAGVAIAGNKDGGVSWMDVNNDGCLDLIVNTNNATLTTRLLINNCDYPNPTFTDITNTHIQGVLGDKLERSAVWGDLNNDGYLDYARNRAYRLEVYTNRGPNDTDPYSLGDENHDPNKVFTSVPSNGFNSEGMAWFDYDGDGWLDLVFDNHNYGVDILRNPADCSVDLYQVTPDSDPLGLPTSATDGDYMSAADFNDDGWVDILVRKMNQDDLFRNDGGTFTSLGNIDQATNSNNGGAVFCDFDNDGDMDLFWTANGTNQIWKQTGVGTGNFVATGEPTASSGAAISATADGCSCGDVDNDGDLDLFVSNPSSSSLLFYNNSTTSTLSFTRNQNGIAVGGNAEGAQFGDYDADGDMDLYVNVKNQNNQLWQNALNNSNYLFVEPLFPLTNGNTRPANGATILLYDASGTNLLVGLREVNSGTGHGTQDPSKVHLGLPNGPTAQYRLIVKFPYTGGVRNTIDTLIRPSDLPAQTIKLIATDVGTAILGCSTGPLPVELLDLRAYPRDEQVDVLWMTATETNNDRFELERSHDNATFELIGTVPGAGNSQSTLQYSFTDVRPFNGDNYYRLKQMDHNGDFEYFDVVHAYIKKEKKSSLRLIPNPTGPGSVLQIEATGLTSNSNTLIEVRTSRGDVVLFDHAITDLQGNLSTQMSVTLDQGLYIVTVASEGEGISSQLVVR